MLNEKEKERYERQILFFGEEKQKQLKTKKVLQVGLGGLGSPLALYLVSAGVGELILFEDDVVSLSNLARQILYKTEDIGKSKAEVAKAALNSLNPHVKITLHSTRLTSSNYSSYISGVDYLVDASDNFATKFLINDIGIAEKIPFTIAGIQGLEGQLISVIPGKTACYRCVFQAPPEKPSTAPIPIFNALCGIVGSFEAMEVIKGLIHVGYRVLNALVIYDGMRNELNIINLKRSDACPCASLFPPDN